MTRPPDRQLLAYLAPYGPHICELTLALRDAVLKEAPEAIECVVRGHALAIGFSFVGKPLKNGFCHIVTYSSHVNLGFNQGALLPDPNRVLMAKRKSIRRTTIRDQSELERRFIQGYPRAAIEQVSASRPREQLERNPKTIARPKRLIKKR